MQHHEGVDRPNKNLIRMKRKKRYSVGVKKNSNTTMIPLDEIVINGDRFLSIHLSPTLMRETKNIRLSLIYRWP